MTDANGAKPQSPPGSHPATLPVSLASGGGTALLALFFIQLGASFDESKKETQEKIDALREALEEDGDQLRSQVHELQIEITKLLAEKK